MTTHDTQTAEQPSSQSALPQKSPQSRRIASALLVIGVLCAIAVGLWQLVLHLQLYEQDLQATQEQILRQARRIESLENEWQAGKKQQQEQVQRLQAKVDALSMQKLSGEVDLPLRLSEAEYLVRMADYRATFFQDTTMALQLLREAKERLAEPTLPTLPPLKEKLSQVMLELQKMEPADAVAISVTINQVIDALSSIPSTSTKRVLSTPEPISTGPGWQRGMQKTWEALKGLVVVRQINTAAKPFLLPEEHTLVLWNIRLELEQAKLAAWRGEGKAFGLSLQQAKLWIEQSFNTEATTTRDALKKLEALQKISWAAAKPNFAELLSLVHNTFSEIQAK